MIRQLRASGGLWISYKNTNVLVDPGPGSLLRMLKSRPKLDASKLDGIILTHKHLDHSNDINLIIEAMTEGGFKKKGMVFAPEDCFGKGGVIFDYVSGFPEKIEYLKEEKTFNVKDFEFHVPLRMKHPVETYGIRFKMNKETISLITDTEYFPDLTKYYKADTLIISVVFYRKREGIEHLCLNEAKDIISSIKPKRAILTHFGMTILRAKPYIIEKSISAELEIDVKCAHDGMTLNF